MSNLYDYYLTHINAMSGYRANWEPAKPIKIGDIGILENGVFTTITQFSENEIKLDIATTENTSDLNYTSSDNVTISVKAEGEAPVAGSTLTNADAGFSIEFKKGEAIVFQVSGYKTIQIRNILDVQKLVLEKSKSGEWVKDWYIITEMLEAENATIIISNSGNFMLDLKAKAAASAGDLKLTNASLGLQVVRDKGSSLNFIGRQGITPMYRVMGLTNPLFGKKRLETRELSAFDEEQPEELTFEVQDFDTGELSDDDGVNEDEL